MPAPTALLKHADDTPPSNVPLPEADGDEDFALEGMNELPEDANAVLQPVRMSGEGDMEIDEEDKPHFAPVKNIVRNNAASHGFLHTSLTMYRRTQHYTSRPAKSRSRRTDSHPSRARGPRSTRP